MKIIFFEEQVINSPFAWESRGHPECACSKRCQPTEIVFRTIKLLRQGHAANMSKGLNLPLHDLLLDSQWLVHYDPLKPLKLATDASAYGIGAVISHILEDGSERPIAFAS